MSHPNRFQLNLLSVAVISTFSFSSNSFADESASERILTAPVVVTATRVEQNSFDLPVSIDAISKEQIQDQQLQVNASETLQRIPGISVQNRQNYAQDLQISSRGFGARAPFGVKGVRLIADDIPITMPDGQGQASIFNLSSAKRIEVMRGPFSALYGNGSGGVIQAFTEDGPTELTVYGSYRYGSDNTQFIGTKLGGQSGSVNYLLNNTWFRTDGYRDHSSSTRDQFNAKIIFTLNNDTSIRFIGNTLHQPDTEDPTGLTLAQVATNRKQVQSNVITYNAKKTIQYLHTGIVVDHNIDQNTSMHVVGYYGERKVEQLLSFNPNGVVDLDRKFGGVDARITRHTDLFNRVLTITAGMDTARLNEVRQGHNNDNGVINSTLTRNENDIVNSFNQYAQLEYQLGEKWQLNGGIRHNHISFKVNDHFVSDGNDSANLNYSKTTPTLGVVFHATPTVNVYGNAGQGFETPTFAEIAYTMNGTGTGTLNAPNTTLQPAVSKSYETGVKAMLGSDTQANLAVFETTVRNEIAPTNNTSGRFAYQNIPKTKRKGIELAIDSNWGNGFTSYIAYTLLDASVAESYTKKVSNVLQTINAGNRIPSVAKNTFYAETQWKYNPTGFSTALELRYNGKTYADDLNTVADALNKSYTLVNWRAGFSQKFSKFNLSEFIRIDNLFDREYNGSVIVNESNKRYFEPAPLRTWMLGINANYQF